MPRPKAGARPVRIIDRHDKLVPEKDFRLNNGALALSVIEMRAPDGKVMATLCTPDYILGFPTGAEAEAWLQSNRDDFPYPKDGRSFHVVNLTVAMGTH